MPNSKLLVNFNEVDKEDIPLVGGKGANLGEMAQAKFPVPPGFIITTHSYKEFLEFNDFKKQLKAILVSADPNSPKDLQRASSDVAKLFMHGRIPELVAKDIVARYKKMGGLFKKTLVAVRSSATAEDLPGASFAGQQATFLNVKGEASLLESVKKCWSSLFTPRAIFYRAQNKISEDKVLIAVIVQEMVQSEISGVAFTVDPITGQKNTMVIEAVWGLGEMIVQGAVTPDRYRVSRVDLTILSVETARQDVELVRAGYDNKEKKISHSHRERRKLSNDEISKLASILVRIHEHYYFPQDIEWAYYKKKFYIVQSRPITTLKSETLSQSRNVLVRGQLADKILNSTPIIRGFSASPGIASGRVVKIKNAKQLDKVKAGDVLVTEMTSPDYVPAMKKASAIVTDLGGQTSHAAIVSRELGIPCVVGTKNATSFLTEGTVVTVDGQKGLIYKGGFRGGLGDRESIEETFHTQYAAEELKTATKVYVNLAEPEKANEIAARNVDGVGLLRAEFMIAQIGVHPKKMIAEKKQKIFIDRLSKELHSFCEAFYPRPVVYRATDFKTNEYRNLKGGDKFEPVEPNPLLGYRGAFRYVNDPQVFGLELEAIKKVRDSGLKNLWLMIPFVRSPHELSEVKKIIVEHGLIRNSTFHLWLMVELPVNVILLPDFIKVGIDGVSIGSNDLTMLMQGTDRDNSEVAPAFDERSPAVLWALRHVIAVCHKYGITSSICGQAPSSYNDLVQRLVEWGITSVSVNPDAIERVREVIYETEGRVVGRK